MTRRLRTSAPDRHARRTIARLVVLATAFFGLPAVVTATSAAAAGPCDAPVVNKIACENTKPGTPADQWRVYSADDSIVGFTTDISTNVGGTVQFKVKTSSPNWQINIYRLGWYGGNGADLKKTLGPFGAKNQPNCLFVTSTAMTDCGNWTVSASWTVPADAVSGLYYAVLHRNDGGAESDIPFVVRDDASRSDILFQTSDSTWQAYNEYGGNSLYFGTGPGPAGSGYAVSYNRPVIGQSQENWIFNAEVPMLRFLEANGYDLSYFTDIDAKRNGNLIKNHKVYMPVGHDEYWSAEQRTNVEAARAAGVHLAFLTGNEIFWKVRYENSVDASATPNRTIVCYKETKANAKIDPSPQWTGTWRDPRFSPPSDAGKPENALLGNIFVINGRREDRLQVPAAYGKMRLWRNTPLASMAAGSTYTFQPGTLGYEWNVVPDNGFQPPGVGQFSRTTVNVEDGFVLKDYGYTYGAGVETHAITYYEDQTSGAKVFGAGTVQWAWGVDDYHVFSTSTPTSDVRIKQATVNFLADMGAQPKTLQSGLTATTAGTDSTPPAIGFTSVSPSTPVNGTPLTVTGSVTDTGGVVSGIEVSTDGTRWHPATWTAGSSTWTYTFTVPSPGTATLRVRAVDDSLNLSPVATRAYTVGEQACPCGLWTDAVTPTTPKVDDAGRYELGVRFQSAKAGYIRGIQFYKNASNSGTHTGSLWSSTGSLLGTGTFTNETASGWQTLTFNKAIPIQADTAYVASYHTDAGYYAGDQSFFTSDHVAYPLSAPKSATSALNGVYKSGDTGFPTQSNASSNYWVDVVYAADPGPDTIAPAIVSRAPAASQSGARLDLPVTVTFDEPVKASSLDFTLKQGTINVPGAVSLSGDRTVASFTPAAQLTGGTTYTAAIRGSDDTGNLTPTTTWSFTTGQPRPSVCPCTIWDDFAQPEQASANDPGSIELGTKVRFDSNGYVTGVRFYKGPQNTGTHTGSLWNSAGQRLATGTFSNESASGWQTLTFATPAQVTANTTYVVSYHTNTGYYATTSQYFANSGADYKKLHALRSGVDGSNGVYAYGASSFPTASYGNANYWVDVVWTTSLSGDTTPPTVTATTPVVNATNVATGTTVSGTFSEAMEPTSLSLTLTDPGGARITGAVAYDAATRKLTLTPAAALAAGTKYKATLSGADVNGNDMETPLTWSFTVTTTQACPCSLFSAATVPSVTADSDAAPYELGVKFTAAVKMQVSGVKFYKGAGNGGTHTGSLWNSNGQRLATGTFLDETATGWQTLTFATPVTIVPGQTYTASYTAPQGRYAGDAGYFTRTAVTSTPLAAPGDATTPNGVYGAAGGFPTSSYQGGNYWVDVVASPLPGDSTEPTVTARTPAAGATGVGLTSTVTATFSEAMNAGTVKIGVRDAGGAVIGGTTAYDAATGKATFTPAAAYAAGATYGVTVEGSDSAGNALEAPVTWSFTTTTTQACPCSLFSQASVPAVTSANDGDAYELGVRFTTSASTTVTGVRFYKGAGNTGTHTGSLWNAAGQRIATGTFTDETASGWQTLTFATPVAISPGQTYTASYTTTTGRYAYDSGYFGRGPAVSTPLTAPSGSNNGVYKTGSGFPESSFGSTNYWVDVVVG